MVEGCFVFLFTVFGSVVMFHQGQILCIGVNECLEQKGRVFLFFGYAGYTGQKDISLDFLFDEYVYNVVDIVFELCDDEFVLFLGQRSFHGSAESLNIAFERSLLVFIDEVQLRVLLESFYEFDEVGTVDIFINLGLLPLQIDLFLRQLALTQLHVGVLRLLFAVERIAPVVIMDHLHHSPYQIIYDQPT